MKKLLIILLVILINNAHAICNFNTANYLTSRDDPQEIKLIEVNILKSRDYFKNLTKIIKTKENIIYKKYKKNYEAKIIIKYEFGECKYDAVIRQNGDLKDHLQLKNNKIIGSINVKIKEGNILNTNSFKLLMPNTRNDLNEILGIQILKLNNYIVPETFQVKVLINGVASTMLFQENAVKEMLERNKKKEGPIYEGDESRLWDYKGFRNFELEKLSLIRLTNSKMMEKSVNLNEVILKSFSNLQDSYLEICCEETSNEIILNPNGNEDNIFKEYALHIIAMNGWHALRPHNRKFYYDIYTEKFEPVYYDGNLLLDRGLIINNEELKNILSKFHHKKAININTNLVIEKNNYLFNEFKKRILIEEKKGKLYFERSLDNYKKNLKEVSEIMQLINNNNNSYSEIKINKVLEFKNKAFEKKVDINIINSIKFINPYYEVLDSKGKTNKISKDELGKLLSRNTLDNKWSVFINSRSLSNRRNEIKRMKFLNGEISHSEDVAIILNHPKKIMQIFQKTSNAWVLLNGINFTNWSIIFNGNRKLINNEILNNNKINTYGLTGCLNIYKSEFINTKITVNNIDCEDGINIVNSYGIIKNINIYNTSQDGLDIDFSEIIIENITVKNSGNDCIDLSGGKYRIANATLEYCQDKGISVGEKSTFSGKSIKVNNSSIGMAVKDSSTSELYNSEFNEVNFCAKTYNKKNEYDGGFAYFNNLKCTSEFMQDKNSKNTKVINELP